MSVMQVDAKTHLFNKVVTAKQYTISAARITVHGTEPEEQGAVKVASKCFFSTERHQTQALLT